MRKPLAILMMATWAAIILYVLWGPHLADIEARMEHLRQARSQWPTVAGTVVGVEFHDADPTDDNDWSYATIRFQYEASGALRTSLQTLNYYTDAQRAAIRYHPGETVTVYHDPAQAGNAVIEPGKVDLYDVSAWWETLLRILAYPSIVVGCFLIWGCIAGTEPVRKSAALET